MSTVLFVARAFSYFVVRACLYHCVVFCMTLDANFLLKGYSSDQSHFSEINVKLAEKNKYATHSVQRSLEMCEN